MTLRQAILALGMTPPESLSPGRWLRFPGIGKGRGNRAGWCRLITPTLAIYGDWSSGITATWRDAEHQDDGRSEQTLADMRRREREYRAREQRRQADAAKFARQLIAEAVPSTHPYLAAKGFPALSGLVHDGQLMVPVRDATDYRHVHSVQLIAPDGTKRFLPGGRARGAIYRIGTAHARRTVLCEGYATGLTLDAALARLTGAHAVIVCFSAGNLTAVATNFPDALVAADNDISGTGQRAAEATGLPWIMPASPGDYNDLHQQHGLHAVVEAIRAAG